MPSNVVTVWEGEWPQVKICAKRCREAAAAGSDAANSLLNYRTYAASVKELTESSDRAVMSTSKRFSAWVQSTPGVGPACGVAALSTFVFAKSSRWGLAAATRNGVLTGCAAICFAFPHEIRSLVASKMPF